jgi:NAD(P)-dependent dehydrogenase (short-subunit alcohol dehydrogenase family)
MTKSLATEWGPYGIRLNAIAPGPFPTKGAWERLNPQAAGRGDSSGAIPMGRVGEMSELANLAIFLMADGCDYLTGQTIAIDGAMHLSSGGNFAALSKLSDKDWENIRNQIRSANEKDKAQRAV